MRKYFLLCLIVAFWLPGVVAQNFAQPSHRPPIWWHCPPPTFLVECR